jgi:ABC-type multidrug transport system ATPase subunit
LPSKRVNVLFRYDPALSGSVTYGGAHFHDRRGVSADGVSLAYVEQDPRFFSNLTVRETLTLDAALHGGAVQKKLNPVGPVA